MMIKGRKTYKTKIQCSALSHHRNCHLRAFALIELVVALALMALVLSFASAIFKVGIDSQRTAAANAEIMQKLRAITDQLNADFKGLRKDGEIFVVWSANPVGTDATDPNSYERFDKIMFFATGDFDSYNTTPIVRGNLARICYSLARRGNLPVQAQSNERRILSRMQHILTSDPALPKVFDPNSFTDNQWFLWNNRVEYEKMSLDQCLYLPYEQEINMLTVLTGVRVGAPTVGQSAWGPNIDPTDPNCLHMLLCEGIGNFQIQGWYETGQRWVPEIDPDRDGSLFDTDFKLDGAIIDVNNVIGIIYPDVVHGAFVLGGEFEGATPNLNEEEFDLIPGLGRALKFTFTLYDSRGIIKNGRTFTHIIYLDN